MGIEPLLGLRTSGQTKTTEQQILASQGAMWRNFVMDYAFGDVWTPPLAPGPSLFVVSVLAALNTVHGPRSICRGR
ncbi:MAG: hypothetical protein IPK00_24830 [Deltaproteobacteria bacterium]|nr:hypothetical protein [Deltaproteobacteria bacterium]